MAAQDVEGAEKPVREQLKKASIGGLSEEARAAANEVRNTADQSTENEQATIVEGEEIPLDTGVSNTETGEKDNTEPATKPVRYHTRKRSRDSTAEDDELNEHKRKISGERSRAQSPAAEWRRPTVRQSTRPATAPAHPTQRQVRMRLLERL